MCHVFSCLVPVSSLCRRRLAYILYESWLLGVFRIYTTLKPRSSEVCSAYAPSRRRGAYALQTSSDLDSRVVYTRNTPRNHDLYITYTPGYQCGIFPIYARLSDGFTDLRQVHRYTHKRLANWPPDCHGRWGIK